MSAYNNLFPVVGDEIRGGWRFVIPCVGPTCLSHPCVCKDVLRAAINAQSAPRAVEAVTPTATQEEQ